jgi:hypothetical protein
MVSSDRESLAGASCISYLLRYFSHVILLNFPITFVCFTSHVCQIFDAFTCTIISVYLSPIIVRVFGSVSPIVTINNNVNDVKRITQNRRKKH